MKNLFKVLPVIVIMFFTSCEKESAFDEMERLNRVEAKLELENDLLRRINTADNKTYVLQKDAQAHASVTSQFMALEKRVLTPDEIEQLKADVSKDSGADIETIRVAILKSEYELGSIAVLRSITKTEFTELYEQNTSSIGISIKENADEYFYYTIISF